MLLRPTEKSPGVLLMKRGKTGSGGRRHPNPISGIFSTPNPCTLFLKCFSGVAVSASNTAVSQVAEDLVAVGSLCSAVVCS